jgi:hypothetical protein
MTTNPTDEIEAARAALAAAQAEVDRLRGQLSSERGDALKTAIADARAEARRRHPGKASAASQATAHEDTEAAAGVPGRSVTAADGIAAARARAGKR